MDRAEFERRFREAADHAVTFAREFVEERLPDRVRLDLHLNSSYDAHATADEVLYPDDHRTVPRERVTAVSVESAADVLYRDGRVPGWIDLSARAEDGESTILERGVADASPRTTTSSITGRRADRPFTSWGQPFLPTGIGSLDLASASTTASS